VRGACAALLAAAAACSGSARPSADKAGPPPPDVAPAPDAAPPPPTARDYTVAPVPASGTALGLVTLVKVPPGAITAPRAGAAACGGSGVPKLEIAANGGVAGALVWLDVPAGKAPPEHPEPAVITLDGCVPRPRAVLVGAPGGALIVRSASPARHEVSLTFLGEPWLGLPASETLARWTLPLEGGAYDLALPRAGLVRVDTSAAPEQPAWAVVPRHPYHAVTDGDGRWRIDGVPPGTWPVHVWHPVVPGLGTLTASGSAAVVADATVEVNLPMIAK
jgi:hypothetical protein